MFIEYFALEIEEFFHLFSLYHQSTQDFKGKVLTEKSKPRDTAENIYAFLHTILEKMEFAEKVILRRVLIEKRKQQLSPSI